ncbi:MAG: 23S rRNA (pseudouridine(1915)-N(3))-methyltransferase RlmH [Patescibacteria group bacterium]|jgi:23S rRNA (pseudouridine1915-N3)-methyltransferase|nr:23S rRNA (pseudouridine(1915)-N(3))-methyltransferase RlmH [Patescibacteria group bacterium]
MKIQIITVGKRNNPNLDGLISDYNKRISSTVVVNWLIIPSNSQAQDKARLIESENILAKIKPNDTVWLCDERGDQISSTSLSNKLQTLKNTGINRLVIIIGGAYGVDDKLKDRADWVWSFSKMVFPHQIMRLLVIEQLYRALQIERGSGYHHA